MELTPVRIPGKRRRSKSKAALVIRKHLPRKGKLGRPLKMPIASENLSESARSVKRFGKTKPRTLKNIKSRRNMSLLEALPTELLENIFFYCLNLSFPRSSPVIAGKLSSPLVYNQTLTAAFRSTWESTWDEWHHRGNPEAAQLQSEILRCRWFSLPLILSAMSAWIEKRPTSSNLIAEECFEAGFKKFCQSDWVTQWYDDAKCDKRIISEGSYAFSEGVEKGIEIPNSLLEGPWDDDMRRLLYWIVRSGASIDWLNSTSGEIALIGLRNAISTGDLHALHLLIWAGMSEKIDGNTIVWALRHAGGQKQPIVKSLLSFMNDITNADQMLILRELIEMREEAILEHDEQKAELVKFVMANERRINS